MELQADAPDPAVARDADQVPPVRNDPLVPLVLQDRAALRGHSVVIQLGLRRRVRRAAPDIMTTRSIPSSRAQPERLEVTSCWRRPRRPEEGLPEQFRAEIDMPVVGNLGQELAAGIAASSRRSSRRCGATRPVAASELQALDAKRRGRVEHRIEARCPAGYP